MTNAGALLGTPAFMPPELALGQPCDGRADLYSLGCVLYLLGSGRLPFMSTSAHELIAMHGTEPAPPMTGVPPALAHVIDRMLEKDPAQRYQSAAENREALEAAVDGRRYTPAAGVPVDTMPSIGPFPKTTDDLVADETLAPPTPNRMPRRLATAQRDRAREADDRRDDGRGQRHGHSRRRRRARLRATGSSRASTSGCSPRSRPACSRSAVVHSR